MELKEYQQHAQKTALYPNVGTNLIYPTLGLAGEAGEFANKVKKIDRDASGIVSTEMRQCLLEELGDVLWYVSQLSIELGSGLEDVAQTNLEKLISRQTRNVLGGTGDHR